jgi:hypothetical protein
LLWASKRNLNINKTMETIIIISTIGILISLQIIHDCLKDIKRLIKESKQVSIYEMKNKSGNNEQRAKL